MGHYGRFAGSLEQPPRLASWWINRKFVKRFLGIAVERQVPAYASRTLVSWFQSRSSGVRPALTELEASEGKSFSWRTSSPTTPSPRVESPCGVPGGCRLPRHLPCGSTRGGLKSPRGSCARRESAWPGQ